MSLLDADVLIVFARDWTIGSSTSGWPTASSRPGQPTGDPDTQERFDNHFIDSATWRRARAELGGPAGGVFGRD